VASAFIEGAEEGYLAGVDGLHEAVEFTFTPLLVEERSQFIDKLDKCKDRAQQDRVSAMELERLIKSWSFQRADGTQVPVTAKNILRLKFHVFNELLSIIAFGTRGSDTKPSITIEEKLDIDRTEIVSALNGSNLNEEVEEARRKNS
jgi:hypothetical protein